MPLCRCEDPLKAVGAFGLKKKSRTSLHKQGTLTFFLISLSNYQIVKCLQAYLVCW